jgi:hypothetical protein
VAALPNSNGRSGRASDEVPAYSGKARGQAVEGHEVGGYSELGRETARERNRAAVLDQIARKLREREGTAATDCLVREDRAAPSRAARNSRLIDGRHCDQAANTAAMSGVDGIRLLYLASGSSTRRHNTRD